MKVSVFIGLNMKTPPQRKEPQVVLNGIWFSSDGTLPDVVLSNMKASVDKIKSSIYKEHYRVVLWTDKSKFSNEAINDRLSQFDLSPTDVEIKDYREVLHANDDNGSKQINQWVDQFAQADSSKSKLCYAMASDMFRIYLLTKEYPNTPNTIGCYMDCNDVQVTDIPDPATLNGVQLKYVGYKFQESILTKYDASTTHFFNNDIMIVNGENKDLCDRIFSSYLHNLEYVNDKLGGFYEFYEKTIDSVNRLDKATAQAIVFSSTHTMNILDYDIDNRRIFLRDYENGNPVFHEVEQVHPMVELSTQYNVSQGGTWLPPKSNETFSEFSEECERWKSLIIEKRGIADACFYLSKNGFESDTIPENIIELMNRYSDDAIHIARAYALIENFQLDNDTGERLFRIDNVIDFAQKVCGLANKNQLTESNYSTLLNKPNMPLAEYKLLLSGITPAVAEQKLMSDNVDRYKQAVTAIKEKLNEESAEENDSTEKVVHGNQPAG